MRGANNALDGQTMMHQHHHQINHQMNHQNHHHHHHHHHHQQQQNHQQQGSSTPYCRCRVLYLGSAVPHASKEGLLGIQEPLRELYPEQGALGARGIDSWLSVWSNGLLLENVDENRKKVTRFFPIEALHYCAAVRHVRGAGPAALQAPGSPNSASNGPGAADRQQQFLPLDSPFARTPSAGQPPLFAAVLRRTTGIKVLECHAFICKRDMAANALVRCCFHAYADSRFAKGLGPGQEAGGDCPKGSPPATANGTSTPNHPSNGTAERLYTSLSGSSTTLHEGLNGSAATVRLDTASNDDGGSLCNGDENHKVWARGRDELDALYQEQPQPGTLRSARGGSARPRQLLAPPPPPPPPAAPPAPLLQPAHEEAQGSRKGKSGSRKLRKLRGKGQPPEEHQLHPHHQAIYANGYHHPPPAGPHHHTLGHPLRHHLHHLPPPGPHSGSRSVAGTMARPAPQPVLLVPAATLPRKLHHHPKGLRPIPVPIYAPLPVVPGQPIYGTGYGPAPRPPRRSAGHPGEPGPLLLEPGLGQAQRRLALSQADLAQAMTPVPGAERGSESPEATESRFGTGIYRRKGHLNERAFSYSIRAEHRSRSHGSLASLGFAVAPPLPPPGTPNGNLKDHQQLQQMVAGMSVQDNGTEHQHQQMNGKPSGNGSVSSQHNNHYPQPLPRPRAR